MDPVSGALGLLPSKLLELLQAEYNLQKSVRVQVQSLSRELEVIHSTLRRVAAEPPDMLNEQVKNWAREAREASYNFEDRIDTFFVRVVDGCREPIEETGSRWLKSAKKKKKKKMGDLPTKGRAPDDIAAAIEDMMKQLQELNERVRGYTTDDILLRPVTSTSSTVDPRLPAMYRNERELVGIEEVRDELVRLLTQGDAEDDKKREVKVVSIVGLAGVGKTTLAKAVYNRLQVQEQFDCSAFVSVSRNPDWKKVFWDMLLELDEAMYQMGIYTEKRAMDVKQLTDEIRRFLENRRYLIVIDDIWSVEAWKMISLVLCDGNSGSRIITTSRMSDVAAASAAEGRGSRYILKPLSHANSEKLFYKRIFGGERNCPHIKLAEVSDKILKKCSGLPLAIITVASVLASKPWEEWSEVYNSITLRHESNRYVDNMRKVLSFSYYDLPFHLRSCLLHLSIFPENCLFIEKDFLIWKWVAEGFVQKERPGPRISLFEIGERYFNDLVNRSTIQIAEGCLNRGRVYGCRVHPVLFSQIRAISSEENFCTVFEDEHHTSPGNQHSSRRIAMHSIRNVEHNMEKVRSFNASLCFIDGSPQLSSFQVLRVLALEYCPGMNSHHLLKQIGNLVHLRYLGLVGAGVLELQEETLGWLKFLQTLDLRETEIEQLPRNIPDQLVCLCVHQIRTVVEGKIGRLTSLEDLRLRHVTGDIVKLATELSCLRKLRVLVLGFEKMDVGLEKALLESLGHLHKIQRLEIYCKPSTRAVMWEESCWVPSPNVHQLVLGGLLFSRLPSWMINRSPLPLLSHLQLGVEVLEDGDLEIFGRLLPQLRSLIVITTASASNEQQHPITLAHRGSDYVFGLFRVLNFFSTNKAVKFESRRGGPPMAKLEHVELRVRVAQCADSWLSSLANLKSLNKVTVVLNCRGASIAEQEEAEETLRRATGVHPIRRLKLEVTKENGNEEVPLIEQFRFKNPRFEALQSEMEKMQANRQVQVKPDNDSDDEEITPATAANE